MSSSSVYRQLKSFLNTVHNVSKGLCVFIKNVKFILSALAESIYFRKLLCVKLIRNAILQEDSHRDQIQCLRCPLNGTAPSIRSTENNLVKKEQRLELGK
jgi:hypothetical protein